MIRVKRYFVFVLTLVLFLTSCSKSPEISDEMTTLKETTAGRLTTPETTIKTDETTTKKDIEQIILENKFESEFNKEMNNSVIKPTADIHTKTWVMNEITFESEKSYANPFHDVDVDIILTNGKTTLRVPGFWDGNNIWKIRFVCPTEGYWRYKTVCTDETNTALHNQSETLYVSKYDEKYEIYKRGFVKAENGTRYFMYNDGTPFFYLGDTHWSLGEEPISNIKTIVDKRVTQGFTVIQSEPIGAKFNFADGITQEDIQGLRDNDEKFKYIADNGLVHVNASFFFPADMTTFIDNHGGYSDKLIAETVHKETGETVSVYDLSDEAKQHLERISRYWVARYGAFPVMWSLGQEVDKDFYWSRDDFGGHKDWNYLNNPYILVAEYIHKYDAYSQPLSAHQENAYITKATDSDFKNVKGHNFYAAQWSPSLTGNADMEIVKDFWDNSDGKLTINYEGKYCYLWTKNFGARAQGWISYLNGMFGYGWGAHDTWSYLNVYNEDADSDDGVDTITSQEKINATWEDTLEYPSSYQVGYMRNFFEKTVGDWYNLIPRFDDKGYLSMKNDVYASIASNEDNSKIVVYFYNFSDTAVAQKPNSNKSGDKTGTLKNLDPNTVYNYLWFNPIDGKVETVGKFETNTFGNWKISDKKSCDMVLYVYK